jgi:hypothetical protein
MKNENPEAQEVSFGPEPIRIDPIIEEIPSLKCCNDVLIVDDAPFNVISLELIL